MGYLKPHGGIHQGLLSNDAGQALGSTIQMANHNSSRVHHSIDFAAGGGNAALSRSPSK